ncbi:MAG: histidine kinase [Anaerostipes sp.]|nr:histidine kinase [Anaerostipes sp.]
MERIQDQVILLFFCLTSLTYMPLSTGYVLAFFLAVSICSSCYFFQSYVVYGIELILFLGSAHYMPEILSFTPLIFYPLLQHRFHYFWAFILIVLGFIICLCPITELCFLVVGMLIAFYLETKTTRHKVLEYKFRKTRDDSTELNLLLKEKNQTLIEKQDGQVYAATLKERNRIAREIHDNVGHLLSRSILMVGALKAMNQQESLKVPLENLSNTLSDGMNNIRESVHDLHDDFINLEESLHTLVQEFDFCSVQFEYDMGLNVPKDIKYSFITITKEALSNVIKHSNATQVFLYCQEHPSMYQLILQDNGSQSSTSFEGSEGIGLTNMRDRVEALHGNFKLSTQKGFQIFITIPKKGI